MGTSNYDIYLIHGNITVFCGTHAEGFKKDVLYSSLLAELVSISKKPNNPAQLWSEYTEPVSKLGWTTKTRELKRYEFATKSLLDIIESCAGNLLEEDEKQALLNSFLQLKKPQSQSSIIKTIIDKLQANRFLPNVEATAITDTKSPIATSNRLTIVRNNASIVTLQVAFKTTDGLSIDLLDQPILNSIKDRKPNAWSLVSSLDARQYDNIRANVIKKIGNYLNTGLLHVPTPNRVV